MLSVFDRQTMHQRLKCLAHIAIRSISSHLLHPATYETSASKRERRYAMLLTRFENGTFNVRVAAIFQHANDQRLLLHRAEGDSYWSLPGGRVHFGETAGEALIREMREELDTQVTVGALQFVVENFFTLNGTQYHELGLYFACSFNAEHAYYGQETFWGVEDDFELRPNEAFRLEYQWISRNALPDFDVRPHILRPHLAAPLLEVPVHLIGTA